MEEVRGSEGTFGGHVRGLLSAVDGCNVLIYSPSSYLNLHFGNTLLVWIPHLTESGFWGCRGEESPTYLAAITEMVWGLLQGVLVRSVTISPVWANPDLQWEIPCWGSLLARTPTPAWLPGILVEVQEIMLLLFQPFHRPKVRWKGSSSGSISEFFVCLAMQTQVTAVTKLHVPLSGHCNGILIYPGDAGVHLKCAARWELVFFTHYYKILFPNYFFNISGHIFFLFPFNNGY